MSSSTPFLVSGAIVFILAIGLVEWRIRRSRVIQRDREEDEWRETERTIQEALSEPARKQMLVEVREKANGIKASLDHLCQITSTIVGAPAAVVTIVEHDGQRWLAYYGADWIGEDIRKGLIAPLSTSYCQYVVAKNQPLVVEDARRDVRVATADRQTKDDVRAYLGAPVRTGEGVPIGSLCIFDYKPRRWSHKEQVTVESMASLVSF